MQNKAYLVGMVEKSGLDANAGNTFGPGVLLKNFIIKFNRGGLRKWEVGRRKEEKKKEGS
jgi:hypothetical protein